MTIENINVDAAIKKVQGLVAAEKDLSPALEAALEVLLLLVILLTNGSKPPSSDPHGKKTAKKPVARKTGGRQGHIGATLNPIAEPDLVAVITGDRRTLPKGECKPVGFENRQVIDLDSSAFVTEQRAEVLEDQKNFQLTFPLPRSAQDADFGEEGSSAGKTKRTARS